MVLRDVDEGLRVFDARAERERLRHHWEALIEQRAEGVARRVPEREHDALAGDRLARVGLDAGRASAEPTGEDAVAEYDARSALG